MWYGFAKGLELDWIIKVWMGICVNCHVCLGFLWCFLCFGLEFEFYNEFSALSVVHVISEPKESVCRFVIYYDVVCLVMLCFCVCYVSLCLFSQKLKIIYRIPIWCRNYFVRDSFSLRFLWRRMLWGNRRGHSAQKSTFFIDADFDRTSTTE